MNSTPWNRPFCRWLEPAWINNRRAKLPLFYWPTNIFGFFPLGASFNKHVRAHARHKAVFTWLADCSKSGDKWDAKLQNYFCKIFTKKAKAPKRPPNRAKFDRNPPERAFDREKLCGNKASFSSHKARKNYPYRRKALKHKKERPKGLPCFLYLKYTI